MLHYTGSTLTEGQLIFCGRQSTMREHQQARLTEPWHQLSLLFRAWLLSSRKACAPTSTWSYNQRLDDLGNEADSHLPIESVQMCFGWVFTQLSRSCAPHTLYTVHFTFQPAYDRQEMALVHQKSMRICFLPSGLSYYDCSFKRR